MTELSPRIDSLPKAELHLHLEGSIQPATACILMARQGVQATEQEVRRRYTFGNFQEFVEAARSCGSNTVVAFGIGGDELQVPTAEFRGVYDRASELGFHRLMHAGEVGGPEKIREAIELLRVERIGHGIAAIQDPSLMDLLAERKIPLELCPQSNLRTGALARQLARHPVQIEDHPLPRSEEHTSELQSRRD